MLGALVLGAPVLESFSTARSTNARSTGARAPVLPSLELLAPVLQAISYKDQWLQCKHQWYSYSAISSVCYGVSDMSHGHNSTVFRVLFPKISTGQKN